MPNILWKFKSRVETFLFKSKIFDNLIQSALKKISKEDVFFVEIGANDGISNDHLYNNVIKYNWNGVYIEPQKEVFKKLVENLNGRINVYFENIAIINGESKDITIFVPKDTTIKDYSGIASLSRLGGVLNRFSDDELIEQKVEGKPFDFLIDKYNLHKKKYLLLVIDVEGLEKEIIYSIDFKKISPKCILFEHAHLSYDCHREINGYLANKGYKIYIAKYDTMAFLS